MYKLLIVYFCALATHVAIANEQIQIPGTNTVIEVDRVVPHFNPKKAQAGFKMANTISGFVLDTDQIYLIVNPDQRLIFDNDGHLYTVDFASPGSYLKWSETQYGIDGQYTPEIYFYPNARLKTVTGIKRPIPLNVWSKSEGLRTYPINTSVTFYPSGKLLDGEFSYLGSGNYYDVTVQGQKITDVFMIGIDELGNLNRVRSLSSDRYRLIFQDGREEVLKPWDLYFDVDEYLIQANP